MKGKVYLIGAGPGDPELLTLKAYRIVTQAEVILHDELVSPEVLSLARPSADIRNVGKRCGRKTVSQEQIHSWMISSATEGRVVVRLKGGDSLIFGRAGEEMDALRQAGIEFEIVPGVTAALGAAAEARIPLTDRKLASRLIFLSNHRCGEKTPSELQGSISHDTTVVVYMPGNDYRGLAEKMAATGLGQQAPCILISCATSPHQQTHRTTLAKLASIRRLPAPTLLIIGAVAGPSSLKEEDARISECPSVQVADR